MSGVSEAGLSTTVLPAARAGPSPQPAMGIGKVPRHDDPHDADGFVEREVDAAGHGYLLADVAFDAPGVVVEDVADVARLPARVANGVARVGDLEECQIFEVGIDGLGKAAQQSSPIGWGDGCPVGERRLRTGNRRIGRRRVVGFDGGDDLFGGGVDDVGWCSQPLESPVALPVGDGRVERAHFDAAGVGVVVDNVVAERRAGHR